MNSTQALLPIQSLYLHFPFCRHLCNYCDFYKKIGPEKEKLESFHNYLLESWHKHEKLLAENNYQMANLKTFYIGGGTPSLWGQRGVEFLTDFFKHNNIQLEDDCEFTLEVNPGSWTSSGLEAWKDFGVNRFSLGIQSLDERFLKVLDRVHNLEDVHHTLSKFRSLKANYSVDFMLGLPFSKKYERDITKELEEILDYGPAHISLYILTTKDNYIHAKHLPSEEWIEEEYQTVFKLLKSRGFTHYEVSNFAIPGHESLHNLEYWRSGAVAALGASATGFLPARKVRYKWVPGQGPKLNIEQLSEESFKIEKFYMALRSQLGVIPSAFFNGEDLRDFYQLTQSWQKRGLLKSCSEEKVEASSQGYLVLDSMIDEVFSHTKGL